MMTSARVKPGGRQHRRQLRARAAELGLAGAELIAQVADDLTRRCGLRPRVAWRLACDLSLDEAAARYNAAANDPHAAMRGGRLWEFEQWPRRGSRPRIPTLEILAAVYGCHWTCLVDLDDLAKMPADDRERYRSATGDRSDDGPARVGRLVVTGARRAVEAAQRLSHTNVDQAELEWLRHEVAELSRSYLHRSAYPLFRRGTRLYDRMLELLAGRQRPNQTRELYALAALCGGVLAWLAEDLGHQLAAADHAEAAWILAEQADHPEARQRVRVVQSRLAFWAGDLVESARLAADGQRYPAAGHTDVFLTLLEARAWAAAGEREATEAALGRWEDRAAGPAPDRCDNFTLTLDRQLYLAGNAHLSLGRNGDAVDRLRGSQREFAMLRPDYRFFGTEMLNHIDICRAHVANREFDGALEAIRPVLRLRTDQRIRMLLLALRRVRSESADAGAGRTRAGRELDHAVRQILRAGQPAEDVLGS